MTVSIRWATSLVSAALLLSVLARPASAQTTQTKQVMREKLGQAEQLLAALVTSNWAGMARNATALNAVTTKPGWDVLRLPEYAKQTTAFQTAVRTVTAAAGRRDQREALAAYNALVASCVECHRYVARARLAVFVPIEATPPLGPRASNRRPSRYSARR